MTPEEFKRYYTLESLFKESETMCDPIEYMQKKKKLLHDIVEWLLHPYYEEIKHLPKEEEKP